MNFFKKLGNTMKFFEKGKHLPERHPEDQSDMFVRFGYSGENIANLTISSMLAKSADLVAGDRVLMGYDEKMRRMALRKTTRSDPNGFLLKAINYKNGVSGTLRIHAVKIFFDHNPGVPKIKSRMNASVHKARKVLFFECVETLGLKKFVPRKKTEIRLPSPVMARLTAEVGPKGRSEKILELLEKYFKELDEATEANGETKEIEELASDFANELNL
jgi:hypothetical protein